jgi:hypothetical protein
MSSAMTARTRKSAAAGIQLGLALLVCDGSFAQSTLSVRAGVWTGSLEAEYESERERAQSSAGTADIESTLRRVAERVTIRNEGFYVLDPRLARGNAGLTFSLLQARDSANGVPTSSNFRLTGYAFDALFFAEKPYYGSLYANRNESVLSQPFGRTALTYENRGATVRLGEESALKNWGIRHLSAEVRVERQHIDEATTSVLGQGFRRNERRDIFDFSGRNGFETADLDWSYEFNNIEDQTYPQGNFHSQMANLGYSVDFGATLNRRSETRLSYASRTGVYPNTVFTADERVHIAHFTNLSSDYDFQLTRFDTKAGRTVSEIGAFQLRHELYKNLTTSVQASGTRTDLPTGLRNSYSGQLDFNYRRSLPWNGNVVLHLGGRNQINNNRLDASQIAVVDEPHAAPSPLGAGSGFLLSQSFVIDSSVLVVDTRGGARLATTLGIDYELVPEGNGLRVIPIVTSAVIQPGDPLAISYSYEVDPSAKYATTSRSAGGGVNFRWVTFSVAHEQTDQKLISGQDSGFLQTSQRDTAEFDLYGTWKSLQAQAGVAYLRYESTPLAYTEHRYREFVSYRPLRNMTVTLSADWTLTHFSLPAHETDARTARLSVDWYGLGGWSATGLVARRAYADSLLPTETIDEASLVARLDYGKVSLVSALAASDRERGGFKTASWRVNVSAIRRF